MYSIEQMRRLHVSTGPFVWIYILTCIIHAADWRNHVRTLLRDTRWLALVHVTFHRLRSLADGVTTSLSHSSSSVQRDQVQRLIAICKWFWRCLMRRSVLHFGDSLHSRVSAFLGRNITEMPVTATWCQSVCRSVHPSICVQYWRSYTLHVVSIY